MAEPDLAPRLLVVVMDAAEPTLVRQWAAEGHLPNLAALFARGISGDIASVDGFFVGSTWPSLYTGTSPARHGFHYTVQLEPGTYRYAFPAERGLTDVEPFWRALGRAGRRTAIVDVPLVPLDSTVNGVHVIEWGGHDALYGFATSPPGLGPALVASHGRHPVPPNCDGTRNGVAEYADFVDRLVRGAEGRGPLMRQVLTDGPWDLVMHVFSETHCVGHQCWHLHDPAHPGHDAAVRAAIGDPMLRVYAAADRALGDMLEAAGNTHVIVCSGHGMGHWFGAHFLLRDILVRLGVTVVPAPEPEAPRTGLRSAAARAWHLLPARLRERIRPLLGRSRTEPAGPPALGVVPGTSACFPVGNGLAVGGIRLNIAGREPAGVLQPGAEVESFIERLRSDLLAIEDARTGRPLIRAVRRTAEVHTGPLVDRLPDLLVEWDDAVPTGSTTVGSGRAAEVRAHSPKVGTVVGTNEYGRTGEHRPRGFIVAAGPGIRPGQLKRAVSVMDLAPTIAARLGVRLEDVDGKVVPELGG